MPGRLDRWLQLVVEAGGSDLLLVSGAPPSVRIDGRLRPLAPEPLDGAAVEESVVEALPEYARNCYESGGVADASYSIASLGRFRINLHRERRQPAAAIRALPTRVPRLAELGLPASIELLSRLPHGLVLIGGPTGSGKSTTLAAIVAEINARDPRHIVTIEDPIEYLHANQSAIIEQVEIGIDAPDFPSALRASLRQAPDVIVVGEMRDPETMRIALAAAETGHLVFSTVHTTDAASTVARIADSFPTERQPTIRQELAMALTAVMTQQLIPKIGGGLVPAAELLIVSYGARQHIRRNALQHFHQEMTITRRLGSFTLEDCLTQLVKGKLIEKHEAFTRAAHPDELDQLLRRIAD
ncbi:MAG TPA: PilT/PilU family type 4a pilus ATPase [Vicinamibacterales bacterium]|nr:PilT/PilU family type 4a pilus ATPase [Vicinamibacterales bacterium]